MILNEGHIGLLKWVRPKIENCTAHGYICVYLEYAALAHFEVDQIEDDPKAYAVLRQLGSAINESLGCHPTMFGYLKHHIAGFAQLSMDAKRDLSNLARLAWIDKMIETRTIV